MTSNLTCDQCSRTVRIDDVGNGPGEWLQVLPIAPPPNLLDSGSMPAAPEGWTFCSPACISAWATNRVAGRTPGPALAPAGLYLG